MRTTLLDAPTFTVAGITYAIRGVRGRLIINGKECRMMVDNVAREIVITDSTTNDALGHAIAELIGHYYGVKKKRKRQTPR